MTVTSDRFELDVRAGERVEIVTPEGVPLVFTIASIGERAYAFTIDLLGIILVILALAMLTLIAVFAGSELVGAFLTLAFFVVRNGWFMFFELRGQGRTPGKRRGGIRVVDASGGPLQPLSMVVRNLTREVEVFLPVVALQNPELVASAGPGWVRAFSVLWVLAFMLVPLFDRRRRRLGDLLAGTMVVREPRRVLDRDLAARRAADEQAADAGAVFTARQLEMYGVYELQVLEKLLREEARGSRTFEAVAERIIRKIGWEGDLEGAGGPRAFLQAFYTAQRARLEHDLSLGRARERKKKGRIGR